MPLRDHFRSPVEDKHSWHELHAGWPMMIVRQLFAILPEGFVSAPGVHLGKEFEIDVSVLEDDERIDSGLHHDSVGGVATCVAPEPTLTLETELAEQDEFEVRIYDARHGRQLVATIELVSPGNKDRPENRRAFVAKVAALLQKDVCVSIVDLVTIRKFNLYGDLLDFIGATDPQLGASPPDLYSVTIRGRKREKNRSVLDMWYYPMTIGQTLPILPIWLDPDLRVLLPLESSYEETCQLLHIR